MGTMLAINGQVINSQEPLPIPVDYDYIGETTGTTEIEIPEGYDDVYCDILDISSNTYYNTSFIADFDSRNRRGGYYFNASNYGGWIIGWDSSTRKAKLLNALSVGHDYTSTAKVKWYAMKHIMQDGGTSRGSVSVTADGTKTYGQLFNALFSLIDMSRINTDSYFILTNATSKTIFKSTTIIDPSNVITHLVFDCVRHSFNEIANNEVVLHATNSEFDVVISTTYTNQTSLVPTSGIIFTVVY